MTAEMRIDLFDGIIAPIVVRNELAHRFQHWSDEVSVGQPHRLGSAEFLLLLDAYKLDTNVLARQISSSFETNRLQRSLNRFSECFHQTKTVSHVVT